MLLSGLTTFMENSSKFRTERMAERYKRKAITPPTRTVPINNPVATMIKISRINSIVSILPPLDEGKNILTQQQNY